MEISKFYRQERAIFNRTLVSLLRMLEIDQIDLGDVDLSPIIKKELL